MADKEDWITRDEAIKLSGLNARTFARRDKEGKCGDHDTREGKSYYDPDVISELAEEEEGGAANSDREIANLIRQLKDSLKVALAHNEKLIQSIVGPATVVNAHYVKLIETLSGQNKEYQDRWYTTLELVESVQATAHERAKQDRKYEDDRRMKAEAWRVLKENIPRAWAMLGKGAKIRELFESLSLEQVMSLVQDENFLTPAQKTALQEIIEQYQREQKQAEKKETTDNGKRESSEQPAEQSADQQPSNGKEAPGKTGTEEST